MNRPFVIGLTGSIGMGKSTTARMFAEAGVPVWDADAAVHRLYATGGAAVGAVAGLCPEAVRDGRVERALLADWVRGRPDRLSRLEDLVHPLVAADRRAFVAGSETDTVLVDVPLLFETGGEKDVDAVVVVTVPPDVQRARVLDRPGMTPERLADILSRQLPDAEKRARADYVIETLTLDDARQGVQDVLEDIGRRQAGAGNRARHGDDGARPRGG